MCTVQQGNGVQKETPLSTIHSHVAVNRGSVARGPWCSFKPVQGSEARRCGRCGSTIKRSGKAYQGWP